MKIVIAVLGLILAFLALSSPNTLSLGGDRSEDYFFVTTRREPTIEERIVAAFGNHANNMLAIARCESGFNPDDRKSWEYALNNKNVGDSKITGYTSWGLFMINAPAFEGWNTAEENIRRAKAKLDSQGYGAWYNCARSAGII